MKKDLIEKEKSQTDSRYYHLHSIGQGQKLVDEFNRKSDEQINNIIEGLTSQKKDELVDHMIEIQKIFKEKE